MNKPTAANVKPPQGAARTIEIMAHMSLPDAALPSGQELAYFTYLCPSQSCFSPDGEFSAPNVKNLFSAGRCHGAAGLLRLGNFEAEGGFSSRLAHRLLNEEDLQRKLISALLSELENNDYYGLHLDFNYLFPFDRDNYSSFVRRLSDKLHEKGFILSLSLPPEDNSALSAGFDYEALGRHADRLSLMSCRFAHELSSPGPLSPIGPLRRCVENAAALIPAQKLLLGISGSGLEWRLPWRQGSEARLISNTAAIERAKAMGLKISYDSFYQAPHFEYSDPYGRRHSSWFEDERSIRAKLDLLDEFSLAGLSLYFWEKSFYAELDRISRPYSVQKLI